MLNGAVYSDDPMDDTGSKNSRKDFFKHFKRNFCDFWDFLLRDSSETEELFGDENDAAENADGKEGDKKRKGDKSAPSAASKPFSSPLFDSVSDAVALFSGSRSRTVRVAATRAGLQLVTSLVKIAKAKAETRDTKQRQLDSESKKKRPNAAMLRALTEALTKTQTRIRGAERMIADAFTKIFTHRFRDIDASVRAACMENIGEWMRSHPLFFLSDVYLKYLGWSLSDKDAKVRKAVLVALRNLYTASNENLALMDTFNARFQPRVKEMINDVDPGVAAEAVSVLEALYEAGVLPREEMGCVLSLLLDANGKIRAAAAAVVPSLLAGDAAAREQAAEDDDDGIAVTTKKTSKSAVNDQDSKTKETLLSLVQIIKNLGGSRARTAAAVDALWDEFGDTLSEWSVALDAFLYEDKSAGKTSGRTKKGDSSKEKQNTFQMDSEQAAGLANLLACSVRRARGEILVRPDGTVRPPTKAQKESFERAREAFTQSAMRSLPAALRKWRSDEQVVAPLLECVTSLRLEHYSLKHKESDFDALTVIVSEIFRAHSGRRAMEACANAFHHAVSEGSESLREIGLKRVEASYVESAEKLRGAVTETLISTKNDKASSKKKKGSSFDAAEDGAQFRARVELARINALLSLLPPPVGSNKPTAVRDLFDDLVTIVQDAAEDKSSLHPRAVAFATRAAAMTLSHSLMDIVERGSSSVTQAEITEHVALRDAFLNSIISLARTSVDAIDGDAEAAVNTTLSADASNLGKRAVPKAAVAAFAHLVVVYQRPRAAAAEAAKAEAKKTSGNKDAPVDAADCAPAPVFTPLELSPDEEQFRVVWDACNQLLDPPAVDDETEQEEDETQSPDHGDEETAKLAYALSVCEAAVCDHRFVAAELLANREQSGAWTDHSISALLGDLKHLGPKAVGDVIFYSLISAFDEVTSGDPEDPETTVAMELAFEEFSARLAHMFNVGSGRDRVVCRHVVEEGLKYVVPTSQPDTEKLSFLSLGLASFVPKLAAGDAKNFQVPLQTVVDAVDTENEQFAPLFDFADRITGRARGGHTAHPSVAPNAGKITEPEEDEDPIEETQGQDDVPIKLPGRRT